MDVRNCKKCGNLFNYSGQPLCPACTKEMEERFAEVRDYIRENPHSPLSVVAEANDVPIQQIKRWIREERLTFTKDSGVVIQCEECGASILTGRYCANCKRTMTNQLTGLYSEKKPERTGVSTKNAKMRFINK